MKKSTLWKVGLGLIIIAAIIWVTVRNSNQPPTDTANTNNPQPAATPEAVASNIKPTQTVAPPPTPTDTESKPGRPKEDTPQPPTPSPTPFYLRHTVEEGEVPVAIAAAYGISVDELLEINQITDPTLLQIGQELLILVTTTPTPIHSPTPTFTPTPTPTPIYHTVEAGETLSGLAQQYNVNAAIIRLANDATGALQPGQTLLIPASHISPDIPVQTHTVAGGDTFDRLAYLYGSTIDDIMAANPDTNPAALRIGQTVIVPVTAPPVNPAADTRAAQIINPEPTSSKLAALQQATLEQTNIRRQANGLPPLQADPDLAVIALAHAQDMIKRGYFAHVTPEGIDLRTRFAQHGVQANWIGENIQFNTRPENETVDSAINWWMNSAPHRANMLHTRFTHLGVGVFEEPEGWYTFVLVFAEYSPSDIGSNTTEEQPVGE